VGVFRGVRAERSVYLQISIINILMVINVTLTEIRVQNIHKMKRDF